MHNINYLIWYVQLYILPEILFLGRRSWFKQDFLYGFLATLLWCGWIFCNHFMSRWNLQKVMGKSNMYLVDGGWKLFLRKMFDFSLLDHFNKQNRSCLDPPSFSAGLNWATEFNLNIWLFKPCLCGVGGVWFIWPHSEYHPTLSMCEGMVWGSVWGLVCVECVGTKLFVSNLI